MKPRTAILRTIGLPLVLLSAIFIGTKCNHETKREENVKPKVINLKDSPKPISSDLK